MSIFTNKSTVELIPQNEINSDFGILRFRSASFNNFDKSKYQNPDGTPNDLAVKKIYECLVKKHRSVFFGSRIDITGYTIGRIEDSLGYYTKNYILGIECYKEKISISIYTALRWIYYYEGQNIIERDNLIELVKRQYPACYKALKMLPKENVSQEEKYLLEEQRTQFLSFKAQLPIFIARQLYRHRGINFTERSGRYTAENTMFYAPDMWRKAPEKATQGSLENEFVNECNVIIETENDAKMWNIPEMLSENTEILNDTNKTNEVIAQLKQLSELINNSVVFECDYENLIQHNYKWYQNNLENGMCKEQARMILPISQMTTTINTVDLYTLSSILAQRLDKHAQKEIRDVAIQLYDIACQEFTKGLVDKLVDIQNRLVF